MTQIGKNIKKIRNVRGLSQQAFADLFNLTRGNISSYEESRAEPRIESIMRIANYFGIPLSDFIEKELSVNELLHYNVNIVIEPERLKAAQQLAKIPYIPVLYIPEFIRNYNDSEFIEKLPFVIIPVNSKFQMIAMEAENQEVFPSEFDFQAGDLLIYDRVTKENIHRIQDKLGMKVDKEGIKWGLYQKNEGKIILALNEWVSYPFDLESKDQYWVLKAFVKQVI